MNRAADVARPRRRAAIVGAARDCARHLPRVLDNLGRIAQIYAETFFVFAVSDSSDDTFKQLETWIANGRTGRVVDLGTSEVSVSDVINRTADVGNDDDSTDVDEWLSELLKDGPVESAEVYKAADAAGLSKDKAKRAKKPSLDFGLETS